MIKLISGYGDYPADKLAHLGEKASQNLLLLAVFSTLKPTPAQLDAAVLALRNAIAMIGPGRAQAIDAAFAVLAKLLADVAVNAPQMLNVTDTDLAEIGLPVAKTPTRTTNAPDACQNLVLRHGPSQSEVLARCKTAGRLIRIYEAQWTLDPNGSDWSDLGTFPNSRSFRFEGLPRGKDIWVRVRARNTVGPGAWSDPATIMVT